MVARIVSGKSIRGILSYNENKLQNAEAELILAAGFPRGPEQLSFKNKLERFEMLTRRNEKTKTNAMHITLNFSRQDTVDNELLKALAFEYMDGIGFGGQPYLVYRHYDAAHPHIHIATVNINDGGERIETHNIGRNQSEKARKELEEKYNLIRAEDQQKEMAFMLRPAELKAISYGRTETKAALSSIVREVTDSYRFTSLPELNAVLRQFNVVADRGAEDSKMYEKQGLVYRLLDDRGQPIGVPIKASSIFGSPTLKHLEKKYQPNAVARRPYGQRLKHLLDKSIEAAEDMGELQARLQAQGIRILLRGNAQGNVYGITYIDNATRAVFNGSDLGKSYGAKAFMERLQPVITAGETEKKAYETLPNLSTPASKDTYPAKERPVIEMLLDVAFSNRHEESGPDPFRRRKKKRLQQE